MTFYRSNETFLLNLSNVRMYDGTSDKDEELT